ncbi:MAG TPA: nuclear transport factor 2 family protein [Thermoanaerobaculia bacterium]|nr:nuclear transport factor 2 family protein [Thermoanaerobaculia bacterium]
MKQKLVFALAALLLCVNAGKVPMSNNEETLRQLNEGYVKAFVHHDMDWYRAHLADDFLCFVSNGAVIDKTTFLQQPQSNVKEWRLDELKIRVFNDNAALIHAISVFTMNDGTVRRSRYTDSYMKIGGEWKAVSAQK